MGECEVSSPDSILPRLGEKGRIKVGTVQAVQSFWKQARGGTGEFGGRQPQFSCQISTDKTFTLGAEGVLPSRYIVSSLRVLKQFAHTLPSG
jgi:hypothetical protein